MDDSEDHREPERSTWEFSGYDREIVARVWSFATPIDGNDLGTWRKDEFGAWIHRLDYGRRNSEFGWEICDVNTGGNSDLLALRPMQWQNYIDQVAALTQSRVTACFAIAFKRSATRFADCAENTFFEPARIRHWHRRGAVFEIVFCRSDECFVVDDHRDHIVAAACTGHLRCAFRFK